ncbi:MAG: hypothetical protein IM473_19155 [Microcystis sp. M015S2]|uniref:hypothetical protein n=1 Tax=Microcystis sp. M145S2 TaxID=2771148 RepID=UPI0025826649|nr:hypothetical protein [Microcystis sp. M145S2]MCA2744447.1 hypothetical protein [Microcystis sp. M015S2]MCA2759288.1 hypothetical protein [Microcystis sp. M145S2]
MVEFTQKRTDSHYKKSITEAAAQVKGLLLFFLRSFQRKKIKEAAGDIRFFFTIWAKKPF